MSAFSALTAPQAIEVVGRVGVYKANMRSDKVFMSSVMGGMLLSFSCGTLLTVSSSEWFSQNAPGLLRVLSAIVFPYGLSMIVLSGTDLCTGSFMYTTVAVLQRRLSVPRALLNWVLSFFGNLAGSLFLVAIIAGYGGVFSTGAYHTTALEFARVKQVVPGWHQIFLRGIGANWLVCMSCYLGMSGRDYASKLVGIWFPAFGFVSLGLDHVVANMFFIPIAIFEGSPDISVGYYIWKGIIPALIGNIVGGSLFVGTFFWYLHITSNPPIAVDGALYEPAAVEGVNTGFGPFKMSFKNSRKTVSDEESGTRGSESA